MDGLDLWHLKYAPVRFNDLSRMIGAASKKMIAERLRRMEEHGLVTRIVVDGAPVSVEYAITPFGRAALGFPGELRKSSETLPEASPNDAETSTS